MIKSYELQHKEKYFNHKANMELINVKVEALKNKLAKVDIKPNDHIFTEFINKIGWNIADTYEVDLCNRTSNGIRWYLCEVEAKKMVDSGEYIVVDEYLQEFETWKEFIEDLKGE